MISLMCGISKIQMNVYIKTKRLRYRTQTYGYETGKKVGRNYIGVWD